MTAPTTAREALIAAIAGDLAQLLDRAEALQAAFAASSQTLDAANTYLATQLPVFEAQMTTLTERAKVLVTRHILARTDAAALQTVEAQTQAMAKAAAQMFDAQVEPRIQRLAQVIAHQVDRIDQPWRPWWTHAATALASSAVTLALAAYWWPR